MLNLPEQRMWSGSATTTVFPRIDTAVTINFNVAERAATIRGRSLFEGGVYFLFITCIDLGKNGGV